MKDALPMFEHSIDARSMGVYENVVLKGVIRRVKQEDYAFGKF